MRSHSLLAIGIVVVGCFGLFAALEPKKAPSEPPPMKGEEARAQRVLPGIQQDGTVQLPNQWKLRPAGRQLEVGDFPVNVAIHPSGQFMAVLHAGMKEHEVVIVDLNRTKQKMVSRVILDQTFYGMCFSPDGKKLYASGGEFELVHEFDFDRGLLSNAKSISLNGTVEKLIIGGISMDPKGQDLFVCGTWGDAIFRIPVDNPNNRVVIPVTRPDAVMGKKELPKGNPPSPPDGRKDGDVPAKAKLPDPCHPYLVLPLADGKKAYVSLWAASCVAVIDLEKNEISG